MYLLIWRDGSLKTLEDNLTIIDVLACADKLLNIVKFRKKNFLQLAMIEEKFLWVPIEPADALWTGIHRFHQ